MNAIVRIFSTIVVILVGLSPSIGLTVLFYFNPDLVGISDDTFEMGFIVYFIVQMILFFVMSTMIKYIWKNTQGTAREVFS